MGKQCNVIQAIISLIVRVAIECWKVKDDLSGTIFRYDCSPWWMSFAQRNFQNFFQYRWMNGEQICSKG